MLNLHVSLLALQVQSPGSVDRETLLVIFVGIIAFFFLALIAGLGIAALYALKLKRDVLKAIEAVKATVQEKAYPVVASTQGLIKDLTPHIRTITENAAEISHTVRAQVTDIDSTLSSVTAKARAQADRVNGMVSSTLNTTSHVVSSVEKGVRVPIREIAGILAGLRTGWEVLTRPSVPSARSEVRRAARHVESWENDVVHDAARAARVNQVPGFSPANTAPAPSKVVSPTRSMVEAGEETAVESQAVGVESSKPASRGFTEEMPHRRTIS